MKPTIRAACPVCGAELDVAYTMIGAPVACPACTNDVVPDVPVGAIYPATGYQMTFADFEQLLQQDAGRSSIRDLLVRWFEYDIAGLGASTLVRSRKGAKVDLLELHRQIQEDEVKQRDLYAVAMSIWR